MKTKRYHSLDAMRGILMIMGVYFHLAFWYAEQGVWPLWFFILMTHYFRMHAFFLISGFFGALLLYRKGAGEMIQNRFKRVFLPLIILAHPISFLSVLGEKYADSGEQNINYLDSLIKHFDSPWKLLSWSTDHLWFLYLLFAMSILGYVMSKVLKLNVEILKRLVGSIFQKPWLAMFTICFLYALLLTLLNIEKAQYGKIYNWFWFIHPSALKGFVAFCFFYFWGWQLYHFRDQIYNLSARTYLKIWISIYIFISVSAFGLFQFGYPSPYDHWNNFWEDNLLKKKVTFIVDMSKDPVVAGEGESPAVYLNVFWENPHGWKMEDIGDGLWTYSIEVPPGEYTYKFRNGFYDHWGPPNWENGDTLKLGGCGYGENGPRKFRVVDEDLTLGIFCWSQCTDCAGNEIATTFHEQSLPLKQKLITSGFIFIHNFGVPACVMFVLLLFVRFCKNSSNRLRYINDSSYWIYIIHIAVISFVIPIIYYEKVNMYLQFFLSAILVTAICFLSYHYLVRKTFIGEFLNGRKYD